MGHCVDTISKAVTLRMISLAHRAVVQGGTFVEVSAGKLGLVEFLGYYPGVQFAGIAVKA